MPRSTAHLLMSVFTLGVLASCAPTQANITLANNEAPNYDALNAALGRRVCVVGALSRDASGFRFLLEPYESEGVVRPSPARIDVDFDNSGIAQSRVRDGQLRRVCGILEDATPWRNCERNACRWYRLRDAHLG